MAEQLRATTRFDARPLMPPSLVFAARSLRVPRIAPLWFVLFLVFRRLLRTIHNQDLYPLLGRLHSKTVIAENSLKIFIRSRLHVDEIVTRKPRFVNDGFAQKLRRR